MNDTLSKQEFYALLLSIFVILAHASFPSFQEGFLKPLGAKLEIKLFGNITADLFGALVPIITSFLLAVYLLFLRKVPLKRYLCCLALAFSFGTMVSSANHAVVIRYEVFSYVLAILVLLLFFQEGSQGGISFGRIRISWQNYIHSLLIIYSVSSLAIFLVDIVYLPFAHFTMYIGGAGLVDAIFLSGLFSFFSLTVVVLLFVIVSEEKRKMAFPMHRKKYKNLIKSVPELLVVLVVTVLLLYPLLVVVPSLSETDRMYFGVRLIAMIVIFVFAYSAIKGYIESRKQRTLEKYL